MKVYVLIQGAYSDYRVIGVFSSEDKARNALEELKKSYSGLDAPTTIEEYELDDLFNYTKHGYKLYTVVMNKEGNALYIKEADYYVTPGYYL